MNDFQTVAQVGDIDEGTGAAFKVGDKIVAVFHANGEYYAIDDLCPHMGASLGTGHLEDGTVTCPWHAWRFSISDGTWVDNPKLKVGCYEVRVSGEEIQVSLPKEQAPPGYSAGESAAEENTAEENTAEENTVEENTVED